MHCLYLLLVTTVRRFCSNQSPSRMQRVYAFEFCFDEPSSGFYIYTEGAGVFGFESYLALRLFLKRDALGGIRRSPGRVKPRYTTFILHIGALQNV